MNGSVNSITFYLRATSSVESVSCGSSLTMNSRVIKMKTLVIAAVIAAVSDAVSVLNVNLDEWNLYKTVTRRHFRSTNEEFSRLQTFLRTKDLIARHNLRFEKGLEHYKIGLNQFADWDPFENASRQNATTHYMEERMLTMRSASGRTIQIPPNVTLPDSVDWNERGAVAEILDQETCGSCYAIVGAEAMEGKMFIKYNKLKQLSPQQILDCSGKYGNEGCNGGTFRNTFRYLSHNKLVGYDNYPYENLVHDKCEIKGTPLSDKVKYYYYILDGDEEKLKYAVANFGPVAVGINADVKTFQLYTEGIYSDPDCDPTLVHAVLVTGYGTDPKTKKDYWILKNSWGPEWGEKGFMKLARNERNMCGIGTLVYAPMID